MFRNVLTYTLLFSLLLQLFSREVIVMSFMLNREYIAKNLCENRNRPELHCDGKCFLAKRLKAEQNRQDQETTERVQKMPVMQLFCQDKFQFSFPSKAVSITSSAFAYLLPIYTASFTKLLRPPQ